MNEWTNEWMTRFLLHICLLSTSAWTLFRPFLYLYETFFFYIPSWWKQKFCGITTSKECKIKHFFLFFKLEVLPTTLVVVNQTHAGKSSPNSLVCFIFSGCPLIFQTAMKTRSPSCVQNNAPAKLPVGWKRGQIKASLRFDLTSLGGIFSAKC